MAPVTALLYCYRQPSLTQEQFRSYIEEKHAPLVKKLLGKDHPATHTRYYIDKDQGYMLGTPLADEADLVAVITFDSPEAMQESMRLRGSDGIREQIEADEDQFMVRSKVKVIVMGEGGVCASINN